MIERSLDRIVEALDKLVYFKAIELGLKPKPTTGKVEDKPVLAERDPEPTQPSPEKTNAEITEKEREKEYRKKLKAEADALQLDYNAKISTKNLKALVDKARAEDDLNKTSKVEEKVDTRPVDIEDAREALKKYAEKCGKEKAKTFLKTFGANNITELSKIPNGMADLISKVKAGEDNGFLS